MSTEKMSTPNKGEKQVKMHLMFLWMNVMKLIIYLIFHSKINYKGWENC